MTVYVPPLYGPRALDSLDSVAWGTLDHAYGTGVTGDMLSDDVRASLACLSREDEFEDGLGGLYANVCHQDTIYEATPHAVPFLACFAAGDAVWIGDASRVAGLLGRIAISACFPTEDGSRAGAFGEGVGEETVAAMRASASALRAIAERHVELADLMRDLERLTGEESRDEEVSNRVAAEVDRLDEHDFGDRPGPEKPLERVQHVKFGAGTVSAREPGKVRVRFDDGVERLMLERFVTPL